MSLQRDFFDGVLKYIDQILMEEDDLQNYKPCMFHECSALQAAEKSFYDILESNQIHVPEKSKFCLENSFHSNFSKHQDVYQCRGEHENITEFLPYNNDLNPSLNLNHCQIPSDNNPNLTYNENHPPNGSKGDRKHHRDGDDYLEEVQSEKVSSSCEELMQSEIYDKVLFCPDLNSTLQTEDSTFHEQLKPKARGARRKRQHDGSGKIDLGNLLIQCAQAVGSSNSQKAHALLMQIRQHSSPYGDGTERLAYYFGHAIEARMTGTGLALYTAFSNRRISAADSLKAYQAYVTAVPFQRMSNIFANKSIYKLATAAKTLHIIDFGILYGFQWPCIIQAISVFPGGPSKLCITGIDFPQPGSRPAERIEETGHHLAIYCKRFKVPFEFKAIAKKWDSVKLEDLQLGKDEKLVVNCLYRLRTVPDETVVENGPRDKVLNLIKRINPDMFVHGVLNGSYSSPFFVMRFREALFHFSSLFHMFEATAIQNDNNRLLFEQEVLARDAMNVIACEGTTRIERPEKYKQWKSRNLRAGFVQLPLHQDVMTEISTKVKLNYHKDFLVHEESEWMLQGWKGRVLYALSLWKPFNK